MRSQQGDSGRREGQRAPGGVEASVGLWTSASVMWGPLGDFE